MALRERLLSRIFFRSMLTAFGNRTPYAAKTKTFVAYFQYKIGPYQSDYYLYFAKQPYLQVYKNEIFNKMYEYEGYDLIRYLETHYKAFDDKADFIRFLRYETSERLKHKVSETYRQNLQATADWLTEKQGLYQAVQEKQLKARIEQDVRSTLDNQAGSGLDTEEIVRSLSGKLASRLEQLVSDTQDKMTSLADSFPAANIELNNHNDLEKLIQLYILVMAIKGSGDANSGNRLFKRFSNTDLASILHLHFRPFKSKKFNTVQLKITECGDRLKINNQRVQKLQQALTEFFY